MRTICRVLDATHKCPVLEKLELSVSNHPLQMLIELVFVTFSDVEFSQSANEDSTSLEKCVSIIKSSFWDVTAAVDADSDHQVVLP